MDKYIWSPNRQGLQDGVYIGVFETKTSAVRYMNSGGPDGWTLYHTDLTAAEPFTEVPVMTGS